MKATLGLEYFGQTQDQRLRLFCHIFDGVTPGLGKAVIGKTPSRRPWVAQIIGLHSQFGFDRCFVDAKTSYNRANGAGSRGVELWFVLESGRYYEVKQQISWRSSDRYFCRVTENGDIVRVAKEEVDQWLRSRSG